MADSVSVGTFALSTLLFLARLRCGTTQWAVPNAIMCLNYSIYDETNEMLRELCSCRSDIVSFSIDPNDVQMKCAVHFCAEIPWHFQSDADRLEG